MPVNPPGTAPTTTSDGRSELRRSVGELGALAHEIQPLDAAVAQLLNRFAEAVSTQRLEEARAYSDALEPRAMAEILVDSPSRLWGIADVVRNVLIFMPI